MAKPISDSKLMKLLQVDRKTLNRFKEIQKHTIKEARRLGKPRQGRIKVLGISGSARDESDMAQEASNSETLLVKCLEYCKRLGADTELIQLRKYDIQPCKACYSTANTQCHFYCTCYLKGTGLQDDMSKFIYDKVLEAEAIIFATPVNNYAMSSYMKLFIDRSISLDGSLKPANPEYPKDKELNKKHMRFIELTADGKIPGSGMLKRFMGKTAGFIVTGHEEGASMVISSLYMYLNGCGMVFPPFNYVYAMSSVCNSTYEDKRLVTGKCYDSQVELLAANILTSARVARLLRRTDWKYAYSEN